MIVQTYRLEAAADLVFVTTARISIGDSCGRIAGGAVSAETFIGVFDTKDGITMA